MTIEGGEGSGKSTNIEFIRSYLEERGVDLVCTREPGGTVYGEKIRNLLLDNASEPLSPCAELLLIFAARAQHLADLILPSLEAGRWVLCDRFTDATYAYQGVGRGLGADQVAQLENLVQDNLRPDLTLILDVPVQLGLERVKRRGNLDRFESEHSTFFESVRNAYLDIARTDTQRYHVVDTCRPIEDVRIDIATALHGMLDR